MTGGRAAADRQMLAEGRTTWALSDTRRAVLTMDRRLLAEGVLSSDQFEQRHPGATP